jgi:hypothetical protein
LLPFMVKVMMVQYLMSDTHKVMTTSHCCVVFALVLVELQLQFLHSKCHCGLWSFLTKPLVDMSWV